MIRFDSGMAGGSRWFVRSRLDRQIALVPGTRLAAQLFWFCWTDGDEPGLGQDSLRGCVAVRCGRPERTRAVPSGGQMAQASHGRGCHALPAHVLGNPKAKFGGARRAQFQVETAKHRCVIVDEHVEGADACLLVGHQLVEMFGQVLEIRVAAVGDRHSEERSIGQLERHHCGFMVRSKKLQLTH
jgi:hypothetical protein